MVEKIYTIPITEIFEEPKGCPICRLYEKAKTKALEYVTGAAMMEPSVRIATNEAGFCREHFDDMMEMNNRLSVALMLESHMDTLEKRIWKGSRGLLGKTDPQKLVELANKTDHSCFVCNRIDEEMKHYLRNVVYLWKTELDFRLLFDKQEGFCLRHTADLLSVASEKLGKKDLAVFTEAVAELGWKYHAALREDLAGFTKSFDYRNAGQPKTERVKGAVENTVSYLSSTKK